MKHFNIKEFDCSETGENEMNPEFLKLLDDLREACGFPFHVTSGYRSPRHSIEAAKKVPGTHAHGIATDIRITDAHQRFKVIELALLAGFTGIGVAKGFLHLDTRKTTPVIWAY